MARRVIAQANLDVNGRLVRAQVEGVTAAEAIDRLEARLRHRLERSAEHWEAKRGGIPRVGPHEWRHQSEPTHRPTYFPRPESERRIMRHKSYSLPTSTVDEAAVEMELLDYDFHLFTEEGTQQDSVLYREGPAEYRLAQVNPESADKPAPFELPLTISPQPAPRLTVEQAIERIGLLAYRSCSSSILPETGGACYITATTGITGLSHRPAERRATLELDSAAFKFSL